jgi:hypothetical protein
MNPAHLMLQLPPHAREIFYKTFFVTFTLIDNKLDRLLHYFITMNTQQCVNPFLLQWKGINRKQSTRWQHISRLKASAFFSLLIFFSYDETQQLILGIGTSIWWVTEPHCEVSVLITNI